MLPTASQCRAAPSPSHMMTTRPGRTSPSPHTPSSLPRPSKPSTGATRGASPWLRRRHCTILAHLWRATPGQYCRIIGGKKAYDLAFVSHQRWRCDPLLLLGSAGLLPRYVNHSPGRVATGAPADASTSPTKAKRVKGAAARKAAVAKAVEALGAAAGKGGGDHGQEEGGGASWRALLSQQLRGGRARGGRGLRRPVRDAQGRRAGRERAAGGPLALAKQPSPRRWWRRR